MPAAVYLADDLTGGDVIAEGLAHVTGHEAGIGERLLGIGGGAREIGHGHRLDALARHVADGRTGAHLGAGGGILADDLTGGDVIAEGLAHVTGHEAGIGERLLGIGGGARGSGTATVSTP